MLTIEVTFPHRRYHATPWGHHVNEGMVEWPPSPWRVLRALLACHHLKGHDIDADQVRIALEAMASATPTYHLPGGVVAHTRHFMPLGDGNTSKIFDTFLRFHDEATLEMHWPGDELEPAAHDAIARLVDRLGYLGRAESWVEARVIAEPTRNANVCIDGATDTHAGVDIVRVLAPIAPSDLPSWRSAALDERLTRTLDEKRSRALARGKDPSKVNLTKKEQQAIDDQLPSTLVDILSVDTSLVHAEGWNRPPGTRWVDYTRPRALMNPAPAPPWRGKEELAPTVARFAISSSVLPLWLHALSFGERVRRALMSLSKGDDGRSALVFSGKDQEGRPLRGHGHAHIFPEAMDGAGRITHFLIYAPMGFDPQARDALQTLTKLSGGKREGEHLQQVVLLDLGHPEELTASTLLGVSKHWVSTTPFIATRHIKRAGGHPKRDEHGDIIGSPIHDLRRLLALSDKPQPTEISTLDSLDIGSRAVGWRRFQQRRTRGGGGQRSQASPTGFRLTFASPVPGPIAVGFGAHLGLGLFAVDRERG